MDRINNTSLSKLSTGSDTGAEAVCGQGENTKRGIHPGAGPESGDRKEPRAKDRSGGDYALAGGHVPDRQGVGCAHHRFIFV